MASISDADKQAIAKRWEELLTTQGVATTGAPAAGVDVKKVFCDDWQTAKTVLQGLQAIVPQPGPIIIGLVISAGDAAHDRLCH